MNRLVLIISMLAITNSVLCQNLDNGNYTNYLQQNQKATDTIKTNKTISSPSNNVAPVYLHEMSKQDKADMCREAVVGDSIILYMYLPGTSQMITSEYQILNNNDMKLRTVEINNKIRKYTGYQITGLCLGTAGGVFYGLSS